MFDYSENIKVYSELHRQDPNNCFYIEQIAINYSFLYDFDKAIRYYEIAISKCYNNPSVFFQLGVCHYLKGNKTSGVKFMDIAIEKARDLNDKELELVYQKEKNDWINKEKNLETFQQGLKIKKPSFLMVLKGFFKKRES